MKQVSHRWLVAGLLGWALMAAFPVDTPAGILEEEWAEGTGSAQAAFQKYGVRRIGVLLAPVDGKPDFGHRYSDRSLLTYEREFDTSAHRLTQDQELTLYEEIRKALTHRGYEVTPLNTKAWKGERLRDIAQAAGGIDAVLAVHYAARRSYAIKDVGEHTWWGPFESVHVTAFSRLYDLESGDLIYGQDAESVGTDLLYENRGEEIAEEIFLGKGSNNEYSAFIYKTDVFDLSTGNRNIPVIRTPEGSIDISYVHLSAAEAFQMRGLYDRLRETADASIETGTVKNSLLDRLLKHTDYRVFEEDVRRFERLSITAFGESFVDAIPSRS